jgi:transcriptional regulator
MVDEPIPPLRGSTVREALREVLEASPMTAKELSAAVGIPEKDVPEHLAHLERSLKATGGKLIVQPAECIACGFVFKDRTRLTRPGRCPKCGEERIDPPVFSLEPSAKASSRAEPAEED